jgi:hypothetical protein
MLSLEYVAGFFDGEGSIGMYRNKGSKCSRYKSGYKSPCWIRSVHITNSYLPVLEQLQQQFGGSLHIVKHQTEPKVTGNKDTWNWGFGAKQDILAFLLLIRPFLIEKAEQADLMIQECRGAPREESVSIAQKLKELKK